MNSNQSRCIDIDSHLLDLTGASHWGIADAGEVDKEAIEFYDDWIAAGHHASMTYMERNTGIRRDPRLLLDGARSIICLAFPYFSPDTPEPRLRIARYAPGRDYHKVLRQRLSACAREIERVYGGSTRVCVDTAPLRERYWAQRCGLGFIGRNNHLIIPGHGSYFFLGFILTTRSFTPTLRNNNARCGSCRKCIYACPTSALSADGRCDTSRCLSYLTIEHRGDFPAGTDIHNTFYGCDRCAEVCPHNHNPEPTGIADFIPRPEILNLTVEQACAMTEEDFNILFNGTAMRRAGLEGLKRNAARLLADEGGLSSREKCVTSRGKKQ